MYSQTTFGENNIYNKHIGNNMGWICPKCGTVWSPFTYCCNYCNTKSVYSKTDEGVSDENK